MYCNVLQHLNWKVKFSLTPVSKKFLGKVVFVKVLLKGGLENRDPLRARVRERALKLSAYMVCRRTCHQMANQQKNKFFALPENIQSINPSNQIRLYCRQSSVDATMYNVLYSFTSKLGKLCKHSYKVSDFQISPTPLNGNST